MDRQVSSSYYERYLLSDLESHNAQLIKEGKSKEERFNILSDIARHQLNILNSSDEVKQISNNK